MELVHVTVSPGPPFEVADFGPGVERSAKGAIYFRPGKVRHITPGELAHIRIAHPDRMGRLVILGKSGAASTENAPIIPPAPPPYTPPTSVAEDDKKDEDPGGGEGEKSGAGEESGDGGTDAGEESGDGGTDAGDSKKDEEKPRKRRSRKRQK